VLAGKEWGFLLIDANNAFNEQNWTSMLYTVQQEWPSGARFVFNCYKHWAMLVLQGNNGTGAFIFSKEGVTQGGPLSMFAYRIGTLPLIRLLKAEFLAVKQPWYADDEGSGGNFSEIHHFFHKLHEISPSFGYYPEPSKSILVAPQPHTTWNPLRQPSLKTLIKASQKMRWRTNAMHYILDCFMLVGCTRACLM
jgi:hypothetical protein